MEESRCALFRVYEGGILVFDSRSRHPSESISSISLQRNSISPDLSKEIEKCDPYGISYIDRYQFSNMFQYPPFKYTQVEYTLVSPLIDTLVFDSKFESGNLSKAVKLSENEYNLYLESDVETKGYTQWFYFSVNTYKENHTVKFNIVNMIKPKSLFSQGLLPWVLSTKSNITANNGWVQGGENVSYCQSHLHRKYSTPSAPKFYYSLSFTYTFEHPNDLVYFSHCFPYTYTDLMDYIREITETQENCKILRVAPLCSTLAGNTCPLITITEDIELYEKCLLGFHTNLKSKKAVVLTSRVHPGETNSSYVIKGSIDFLLSNSHQARALRRKFVFKIVPMLNPDGVIYGNYRCSLLGVDLNRRWKEPNVHLHPTIFYAKAMISQLQEHHQVFLFCDVHGHSNKKDSFMYCCKTRGLNLTEVKENIYIRLVPMLFSRRCEHFNYKNCNFNIEKIKETTGRVVVFREFGVLASFTLEISFFGGSCDEAGVFDIQKLQEIGSFLCKTISFFRAPVKLVQGVERIYKGLISLAPDQKTVDVSEAVKGMNEECLEKVFEDDGNNESDSDSAASDDDDKRIEFKMMNPKIKLRKMPKKIKMPATRTLSRTQLTCAPSSLARIGALKSISSGFSSTSMLKVRKSSMVQIKAIKSTVKLLGMEAKKKG